MSPLAQGAATLAGGLGLFLLGMAMMTDGLRLAAGPALEHILARATRSRTRALASGMLVTALVQSSSAVTVAAIGFVNAGLLALPAALWVLFGANVGTTMTGWIVVTIGLRFKVEALALPLIGLGMLLRLTGPGQRRGAWGGALAGFGLLFLGIALMQQAFGALAGQLQLPQGQGAWAVLAQLGVGALMTVLMQSSSASMAIALTAASSGLLDLQGAAAVVIGANIGTTVTALLASIGGTPNARRAAAAHVAFNLLTGAAALALLPVLVGALAALLRGSGLPDDPATGLAAFHTAFNVLGVLLMAPLAAPLTRWLQRRFRTREEDEAAPRHLDDNVLAVPALAVAALQQEAGRIGGQSWRMLRAALDGGGGAALAADAAAQQTLQRAAARFVEAMQRGTLPRRAARRLARVLRLLRHHESSAELALRAAALPVPPRYGVDELDAALLGFSRSARRLLAVCDEVAEVVFAAPDALASPRPEAVARLAEGRAAMGQRYDEAKSALLAAGAAGQLRMSAMESALRRISALRRGVEEAAMAARLIGHGEREEAEPAGAGNARREPALDACDAAPPSSRLQASLPSRPGASTQAQGDSLQRGPHGAG